MTLRDLFALAVKVIGIWLATVALAGVAGFAAAYLGGGSATAGLAVPYGVENIVMLVLGVALLLLADGFARVLVRDEREVTLSEIVRQRRPAVELCVRVLGLLVLVQLVLDGAGVVYSSVTGTIGIRAFDPFWSNVEAELAVRFLLGYFLLSGARMVSGLVAREPAGGARRATPLGEG